MVCTAAPQEPAESEVLRFLNRMAAAQIVERASGYIDHAADQAARAIRLVAVVWNLYSDSELHGVWAALVDQVGLYTAIGQRWHSLALEGQAPLAEAIDRAKSVYQASEIVASVLRALEVEFADRL